MPKAPNEMGSGHLCIEHEVIMREHVASRSGMESVRNRRKRWKMHKLYGDEPEIAPLAASDHERIRKLEAELALKHPDIVGKPNAAMDILERASRRNNDK
jgi:hypothetical protein